MIKKKALLFILGVFLVLAAAAGCGSTAKTGDPEKKTFTYAMSGQYKPFNFFNEKNELTGFDVEIGKALADKMGMEAKPISTPWQGLISGLKAEKYDAILGSMTITTERQKEVDFSDPYYISGPNVFVRGDSAIKGIQDIKKDTPVGVLISSVYDKEARKYTNSVKNYTSDVTALQDLAKGRVDAVITDRFVGKIAAGEQKLDMKPVGDLILVENIGIAFRKGDPLKDQVNKALKEIKEDGTYLAISKKYFDTDISK
ncbi:MAG: ABC transporter substrate-binding protein [Actinobacteria bacterium]|nr:ABC transporter substrate-binding protein [Actinomycetota bacterium]